jgi:hypothetical protein
MIYPVMNTLRVFCLGIFLLSNSTMFGLALLGQELESEFPATNSLSTNNEDVAINGNGLKSGYKFILEPGYQLGVGKIYRFDRMKLDIVNGYQIGPHFSAGLGVGARYYADAEALLIPFL